MRAIKLINGGHTFVDEEDYDEVSKYNWRKWKNPLSDRLFYAKAEILINYTVFDGVKYGGKYKRVFLHRFLLNPKKDQIIDHVNRNGLDNTRKNLRLCSRKQNAANSSLSKANTSGYKGVCFYKKDKKWAARIGKSGVRGYHLGFFDSPIEAARVYNEEAKKRYGEFAFQNQI